jgi:hypothetical protein
VILGRWRAGGRDQPGAAGGRDAVEHACRGRPEKVGLTDRDLEICARSGRSARKGAGLRRHRRDRRLADRDQRDLAHRHPGAGAVRRHQCRRPDLGGDRGEAVQHEVRRRGGAEIVTRLRSITKRSGTTSTCGVGGGEVFQILPMHGGAVAVQQAPRGRGPRGRIDASDQLESAGRSAQVADQGRVATSASGSPRPRSAHRPRRHGTRAGGGQRNPAGQGTGLPSGETTRQR